MALNYSQFRTKRQELPHCSIFFFAGYSHLKTNPLLTKKLKVMIKTELLKQKLETVGEDIGQELGAKMVKDFQDLFPTEIPSYYVGRNIIDIVLKQPDCVGIRFYSALNEIGEKTFVYVGVNSNEEIISQYSVVDFDGNFSQHMGIIGDRFKPGGKDTATTSTETSWSW